MCAFVCLCACVRVTLYVRVLCCRVLCCRLLWRVVWYGVFCCVW